MKKIKTSLFERAPKLLSSAIKLSQLKDIDTVVNNLSELKGIPQKVGQLISMDFANYIPDEYRDKFSKLQSSSIEIETDKILAIILNQLGEEKYNQILNFESTPLGAGSIGQVHKASIENKNVAIKIRYPDIEKTLHSDLSLILPMAKAYEFFRPKSKDLTILMSEAKNMLTQEMNYIEEAKNIMFFKQALINDQRFYVPSVWIEFSNENIICMEFVEGISLKEFLESEKNSMRKSNMATALLELFIEEFFKLGVVQTDPNFANYLIKTNDQIVLLDFGATKEFSKEFRTLYLKLLQAAFYKEHSQIINYGEKLGLVDRKDNPEAIKLFENFMIDVMSFFREENNPIDFSNEEITKRLLENGWELWKKQRISAPNSNLVFLHRKLGGLFSLLKESKIQMDLHTLWVVIEKFEGKL